MFADKRIVVLLLAISVVRSLRPRRHHSETA
jgi:hypothetical protein